MAKVSIASAEKAPIITGQESKGPVETRAVFQSERDPIHLFQHRLGPEATLQIAGSPTDWVVYLWEGTAEAGGVHLEAQSSAIVEYGASLEITAGSEGATLLAFRLKDRSDDDLAGGHVHLLP